MMGKINSFHALAGSAFQANPNPGHVVEYATRPLTLDIEGDHSLRGVPQSLTNMELNPCTIIGNLKPNNSPHYPDF